MPGSKDEARVSIGSVSHPLNDSLIRELKQR